MGQSDLLNSPWLFCEELIPLKGAVCPCDSRLYAITVVTGSSTFGGYMYSQNACLRNEEEAGVLWGWPDKTEGSCFGGSSRITSEVIQLAWVLPGYQCLDHSLLGFCFWNWWSTIQASPRKPTSISITNVLPKGPFQGTTALLLLWAPFSSGRLWSTWLESEPWQPTSLAMLHFGGRASGGIESSQTQNSCLRCWTSVWLFQLH